MPNFIVPSLLLLVAAILLLAACQDGPGYSPVYIPPVGGGHDMYGARGGGMYGPYGPRQPVMCTIHGKMIMC